MSFKTITAAIKVGIVGIIENGTIVICVGLLSMTQMCIGRTEQPQGGRASYPTVIGYLTTLCGRKLHSVQFHL